MKSILVSVGVGLGCAALYYHVIGPKISEAMAKAPAPAAKV